MSEVGIYFYISREFDLENLQFFFATKLIGTWKVTMFLDENNKISIEHSKKEQTHSEKVMNCQHLKSEDSYVYRAFCLRPTFA
jgi:hypothetical protein